MFDRLLSVYNRKRVDCRLARRANGELQAQWLQTTMNEGELR